MYAARRNLPQTLHGILSSWQARCDRRRSLVANEALQICEVEEEGKKKDSSGFLLSFKTTFG